MIVIGEPSSDLNRIIIRCLLLFVCLFFEEVLSGAIWAGRWNEVRLPRRTKTIAYWAALYGAYVNWLITASAAALGTAALSPITGAGHVGKPWQETLVTVGFLSVGVSIVASSIIILRDLRGSATA